MAVIAQTLITGTGARALTATTLTAADTLVYKEGADQILILRNGTAGALTVLIDGDASVPVQVPGLGAVPTAAGFSTGAIAAGASVAIPLDSIRAFLLGVVNVTGGTGITATLTSKF
jgi:hypothetical protein